MASTRRFHRAHYGLALCLIEGPAKDYNAAVEQLQPVAANKEFADYPYVLYYLRCRSAASASGHRPQAVAKPNEAAQHKAEAHKRFEEAAKQFAAAVTAFADRAKDVPPDVKELPIDLEWAARCALRSGRNAAAVAQGQGGPRCRAAARRR